ncbi:MAG: hypothetical protein HFE39_07585 [Clostridiales bacterium]|jgi:hypothetical protein|nr:hypothetical protein [Clostridiales bacterium]
MAEDGGAAEKQTQFYFNCLAHKKSSAYTNFRHVYSQPSSVNRLTAFHALKKRNPFAFWQKGFAPWLIT